ncbi:NUDIX domain-containing protein [Candidatus Uhrbacteria bacterium]|nr:NUDIX domain-containing protein [Candidatus Uhrbacteria bacterium]
MATIGAFGVIFDADGRVLLCHRTDRDLWNLPGGTMESGEVPWMTVIREVEEEVGVQVVVEQWSSISFKPQNDDLVFTYICRVVGGALRTSAEADEIAYFPVDAIPENTSPRQVERIRHAARDRATCVVNVQSPTTETTIARAFGAQTATADWPRV